LKTRIIINRFNLAMGLWGQSQKWTTAVSYEISKEHGIRSHNYAPYEQTLPQWARGMWVRCKLKASRREAQAAVRLQNTHVSAEILDKINR
jgi:hypothetical protein